MGPWSHGDWARNSASAVIGNIKFGDSILFFQKNIEANFFRHFLKEWQRRKQITRSLCFDTGARLKTYDVWPPKKCSKESLFGTRQINDRKMMVDFRNSSVILKTVLY
jgi:predicted acyl esterase